MTITIDNSTAEGGLDITDVWFDARRTDREKNEIDHRVCGRVLPCAPKRAKGNLR